MANYIKNLLISVDQFANTVLGGDPDETISSRAGKNKNGWVWKVLCKMLHLIDPHHCEKSKEQDEGKDAIIS